MKTPDIQRGIASRHCRTGGNAPDLGRVPRLHDLELQAGLRRSRRRGGHDQSARKRAILIWSGVLSAVTLAVIALAISVWLLPRISTLSETIATQNALQHEARVRVASKFPSPSREEALELVKRALSNRDPNRLESLFRMGDASRAEVMDFLKTSQLRDGPVDRYEWLSSMDSAGLLMEGVLIVYENKGKSVERLAFLTPDLAGSWKTDFCAFARSIRPSWNELLEKGAEQAVVRVFVSQDVYYNGPFSDEKEWVCYCIASPDTEELLRGYCRIGSPQAAAMQQLLSQGQRLSRATLEIHRVKDAGSRQFEITRLLAEDWVVAGTPHDPS